jgi:hypothetical protein
MPAPVITTQPSSKVSAKDKEVSLTVVATGAVSYQWYTRTFNDEEFGTPNNIPNTNSPTLKIQYDSNLHTLNSPRKYGVEITNTTGTISSNEVEVIFTPVSGLTLVVNNNNDRVLSWTAVPNSNYKVQLMEGVDGVGPTKDVTSPTVTFTADELIGLTTIKLTAIDKTTNAESVPLVIKDTAAARAYAYNTDFELIEGKDFIIIATALPETFVGSDISYEPKFFVSVDNAAPISSKSRAIVLANAGLTGVAKSIKVTVCSIFYTLTVTKTSTATNYTTTTPAPLLASKLIDYLLIVQPTATTVLPLAIQQSLLSEPLTEAQLTTLGTNHPTGIKVGDTMVLFPKNNEAIITSGPGPSYRPTKIKIRIPANGPWSPIKILDDGTTVQYKGIVNGVKQFIASGPTVESSPKTLNDGETFRVTIINVGFRLVTVSFGSINLNIGNAPVDNSFPARVNPYIALSNVLIYTKATVDALVAGTPLPAVPRVAWALSGVNAGSVMRDLHRIVVVADDAGRHLQRWARVQYVNGSASEGVDDTLADYGCGWVCVWDASGIAPVY